MSFFREEPDRAHSMARILRRLGLKQAHRKTLKHLLQELLREGVLEKRGRSQYRLKRPRQFVEGILHRHPSGFAFLLVEGGTDVFIPPPHVGRAMHGDRVRVEILRLRKGRNPEGRVVKILEPGRRKFVGTLRKLDGRWVILPDDPVHAEVLPLLPARKGAPRPKLHDGDKVLFRIRRKGAELLKVFGSEDDPSIDLQVILHKHELDPGFPRNVEAEMLDLHPDDRRRKDRRPLLVWTIDPYDARDFDDAITVERMRDGGFRVGVHIADVAAYVDPGTRTDQEARKRALSVYLLDLVVPMLPHHLSSDQCSLRPGEDRRAFTVWMTFSPNGERLRTRFERTWIHSRARLTYEDAQRLIDGEPYPVDEPSVVTSPGRTLPRLRTALQHAADIARLLRQRRMERGGLDFDLPEALIKLIPGGGVAEIRPRPVLFAHRLIEELMIAANEAVGEALKRARVPTLYRVHDKPDPQKIQTFYRIAEKVLGERLQPGNAVDLQMLQDILRRVEGKPEEPLLNYLLLRSMKRAQYAPEPSGHFGLGSPHYLHFTSPIRRYPDLVVHRSLWAYLSGESPPHTLDELAAMATHASHRERLADEAERELLDLKKMEYMRHHVGEAFEGIVTHLTPFGIFVELKDLLVEGLIPIETLPGHWTYDAENVEMVGEGVGQRLTLGETLRVEVVEVRKWARRMTLRWIPDVSKPDPKP